MTIVMTHIGVLLYPGLPQLDLTGPFEVLHRVPDAGVHLLWKTLDPVAADAELRLCPMTTLDARDETVGLRCAGHPG
jgi:cyclohexyl-isocyanide hydratase